ncbi:polysaccharide biosynthesis protein [Chloroherpeton thalassium ATCC 35110]|uniref:Polysaccharide biosynthesis protein n=1 Tax=Chloroherpeton thalassium (strain ATCC 35110 / GB-78) TaxID=517418 RepID=B3QSS6_CHLT3|nr:oligosaccharide flippase family protein [Chloroherpeton thalassium]ACF14123.1 polysaccharide biosynthesis protein [Chloroherpeton thalassium ATCC 35110]
MLSKLKLLAKDSAIYGASTVLSRGLNYILVPLYANLLTPEANGIQTVIYANIAFANVLFTYGMETAYMKFAADAKNDGGLVARYFSTAFLSLLLSSLLFSSAIALGAPSVATLIGLDESAAMFIRYSAIILLLDTLAVIPLADLRLQRKAVQFAIVRVGGVLAIVVSTMAFLLVLNMDLEGAFLGNIVGSALSFLLLLPSWRTLKILFAQNLWKELLSLGLPYVPTGITGLLIRLIDRNILIRVPDEKVHALYPMPLTSAEMVGIYGRVVAFGLLAQLLVQVFRFAWQPFFLQHASDTDAKKLFSKILTISSVGILVISFAAALFVPLLIQVHFFHKFYLLPPAFWIGLPILPVIFFSFMFEVISTNLSAGILIEKKTGYLPIVSAVGAGLTVALCIPLSWEYGMMGAAIATTAGTIAMAAAMYHFSQKVYPNTYEWGKIGGLFTIAVGLYAIPAYFEAGIWLRLLAFGGFLVAFVFLFKNEFSQIHARLKRR